jgi:hypothetical protein
MMMKNTTTSEDTIIIKANVTSCAIEVFSPYLRFSYALNAPESKRQYPKRFNQSKKIVDSIILICSLMNYHI